VAEKNLVYNPDGNWAEIGRDPHPQRNDPHFFTRDHSIVLNRPVSQQVRAPTIIREPFVTLPSAPRVMFNDPSTRNALSFFDPRGFQAAFGAEKKQEPVPEEVHEEEEVVEAVPEVVEEEEEQAEKLSKAKAELVERQQRRKERVSIRAMMAPVAPRPQTAPPAKPRSKQLRPEPPPFAIAPIR
jgi:hypothetical protein